MGTEIERKFLVRDDRWRREPVIRRIEYRQGWLASDPACSIRIRVSDEDAFLNIKGTTIGVQRLEFEYPLPREDALTLLDQLCTGPQIEKTRHCIRVADHVWEVDEFHGANAGLVVAEIELEDPDEPFERPSWLGEEVSHDARYYNTCLARHPWSEWTDAERGLASEHDSGIVDDNAGNNPN
ncbi:MAG: CYTH domain-containing protein [Gammaproteobacteria bacterium]|nr:MAG: CYTH domain-containing protein [Gammaproteobacteria bacterium]